MLAHQPMECQPSRMVVLVAMYQRPSPSVSANFKTAPRITAQIRIVPNSVPAVSEETMSPAPTPAAATPRPGPMSLTRVPHPDGAPPAARAARSETPLTPGPAPVAGATRAGPMSFSRFPQLDGASPAVAPPVGLSVTSALDSPSRKPFPSVHYTPDPD